MARTKSKKWYKNHVDDTYVRQAQRDGFRSRAVYKLQEIDAQDHLLQGVEVIIDLGSAPGAWSQWARQRNPKARIIAVDRLPMDPIPGVEFVQGDFQDDDILEQLLQLIGDAAVGLVMSDMAPNITGIKHVDQPRSLGLAELAFDLAVKVLKPGGHLLMKVFQGPGVDEFKKQLRDHFEKVIVRKPKASKLHSSEIYLLARNFSMV